MRTHVALSFIVLGMLGTTTTTLLARQGGVAELVVMRVDHSNPTGSGAIFVDMYTFTGTPVGLPLAAPSTGPDAVCLPAVTDHDRHMHLSMTGRVVTFGAYGAAPGPNDPRASAALQVPRVACAFSSGSDSIHVGPRLIDAYDFTTVRSVLVPDQSLWLAGGNGGGTTTSGGLRFTTSSSERSSNLSQVQILGLERDPDDVRDIGVFGYQLYECAGSLESVGNGVFAVGTGLPRQGSQTLSAPLNPDGAATSSFFFLHLNPGLAGLDTLYTAATSAAGTGVHKYTIQPGGAWAPRGHFPLAGVDHVIAKENDDGSVTIFAGNAEAVTAITDATPLTSILSETTPSSVIITPPKGFTLGGIAFPPSEGPECRCDWNGDLVVDSQDLFEFLPAFFVRAADYNFDGVTNSQDFFDFLACFFNGGCQ